MTVSIIYYLSSIFISWYSFYSLGPTFKWKEKINCPFLHKGLNYSLYSLINVNTDDKCNLNKKLKEIRGELKIVFIIWSSEQDKDKGY